MIREHTQFTNGQVTRIYLPASVDNSIKNISSPDDHFDTSVERQMKAKLARKKNKVLKLVQAVGKTGYNKYQNYNFVEECQVVRAVRSALIKASLSFGVSSFEILQPMTIKTRYGQIYNYTIKMNISLTDTETGFAENYPWLGMGCDPSDKALYKAYTSGVKYFLLKNFLLPTDDDVERYNDPVLDDRKQFDLPQKPDKAVCTGKRTRPENKPVNEERPLMNEANLKIMKNLAEFYQKKTPEGTKFDEQKMHEAVWEHFHMWPNVNAAAKKIKETIDIREIVVFAK